MVRLALGTHLRSSELSERRTILMDALLKEVGETYDMWPTPRDAPTYPRLRVGTPTYESKDGMRWHFKRAGDEPFYHYRTMLPSQIIFDLGDRLPGEPPEGNWPRCRDESHALWDAMSHLGLKGWAALSGGKGTHTELFGRTDWMSPDAVDNMRPDGTYLEWRTAVARTIISIATIYLNDGDPFGPRRMNYDVRLIAPAPESRQVREFGEAKVGGDGKRKALWGLLPTEIPRLPSTREVAYEMAANRVREGLLTPIPESIPVERGLDRLAMVQVRDLTGGCCPRGPQCMPGPHRTSEDWGGFCEECPGLR